MAIEWNSITWRHMATRFADFGGISEREAYSLQPPRPIYVSLSLIFTLALRRYV